MDDIKEQIVATLSQQGTLPSLRAQLRAAVFAAIQGTTASQTARCERRDWLLSTEEGLSVAALVRDFLVWCELFSTTKVFDAEIDGAEELGDRTDVAHQLFLNSAEDQPLLLTILQVFLQHLPEPSASLQVQFGSFRRGEVEQLEDAESSQFRTESDFGALDAFKTERLEGALIKAVHNQLASPPLLSAPDNNNAAPDSNEPVTDDQPDDQPLSADVDHMGKTKVDLFALDLEDPSSLRSHPTRISDVGELSPTRKSVEDLKKQLQSQGLSLTSPLASPERPKSARTDVSA